MYGNRITPPPKVKTDSMILLNRIKESISGGGGVLGAPVPIGILRAVDSRPESLSKVKAII